MTVSRGQPILKEGPRKWKDLLYASIVADGSCLPPVIMIEDKRCSKIELDNGFVIRVKSSKGPGNDTTLRWLDCVSDYLLDEPFLLLDNLRGHKNKDFLDRLEELGITPKFFPSGAGKFLDPIDNSFAAVVKRNYYLDVKKTHSDMVHSICDNYYKISDSTIQNYFKSIGYTTHENIEDIAKRLILRGYYKGAISQERQKEMTSIYKQWKMQIHNLYQKGIRPKEAPKDLDNLTLDGKYWRFYHK